MIAHHRELIAWLQSAGAENARIEPSGKHCKLVFAWRGEERSSPISRTPSDRRATRNQITELRHMLGLVGEYAVD